jgi:hypothetical protein
MSLWTDRIATLTQPKWWIKLDGTTAGSSPTTEANSGNFGAWNSVTPSGSTAGCVSVANGKSNNYWNFPNGNNASTGRRTFSFDPSTDDSGAIFGSPFSIEFFIRGTYPSGNSTQYGVFSIGASNGSPRNQAYIPAAGQFNAGKLTWVFGGTVTASIASTASVNDGNWHHVVLTYGGSGNSYRKRMYIDGTQQGSDDTTNPGSYLYTMFDRYSNLSIGTGADGASTTSYMGDLDEFLIYGYELTSTQVSGNYNSVSAVNASYTSAVMSVSNATLPMPIISATKTINYADTTKTASVDIVDPSVSTTRNINIDGGGVSTASILVVDPTITTTKNIEYSHTASTASTLMTTANISTQKYLSVFASPMTASALLSSNVFYGSTVEDNSYTLIMREVSTSGANTDAAHGFEIGTQSSGAPDQIDLRQALVIKPSSGFPTYNKIIKVRINNNHVTISNPGGDTTSNTFNVYVLTGNPTSGTFTTGGYNAFTTNRELLYTTRDNDANGVYLDLTGAFADSRTETYGMMVEHVHTETSGSGTVWDRTEFSGSGLDNGKLLYVLTTDFVSKNINADLMTTSVNMTDATIYVERYLNFTDGVATASALITDASVSISNVINYDASSLTASATQTMPDFSRTVEYPHEHAEAFGVLTTAYPYVVMNAIINASAMTQTATLEMPGGSFSGMTTSSHMSASATMVMPAFRLDDGFNVSGNVLTASAEIVQPSTESQLLGIVFAQPMIAKRSDIVTPPAYINLSSDKWWSRLYAQHGVRHGERWKTDNLPGEGSSSAYAFFKLFNDVSTDQVWPTNNVAPKLANQAIWAMVQDYPPSASTDAYNVTYATMYQPTFSKVEPRLVTGTFDPYGRKAVKFQNVQYSVPENASVADRPYSLEFSIKTTKSNQILATGNWYSWLYYGSTVGSIGLKDGKLFGGVWTGASTTPFPGYSTSLRNDILYGRKRIDDGQWHHIVIQWGFDDRVQYWIDGQLDIQTIGGGAGPKMRPYKFGYNSDDVNLYSDFETSAWSYDAAMFVGYRDLLLNAYAYIDYDPIKPEPFYASMLATPDNKARGNRGRALMLYWWPTAFGTNGYAGVGYTGVPWQFPRGGHTYDQGVAGLWDYDTGFQFSTWDFKQDHPQRWYDWDIFPVDISGRYVSEVVKPEAYGGEKNIKEIVYTGDDTYPLSTPDWRRGKENIRGTFRDPITDAPRYIDILNDIDLSQFDMIIFRNYPNQSREQDSFSKSEIYDSYFGGQERELYEKFLVSLRSAVDTGISLFINDYQLAIDFGIIDRVEPVPLLIDDIGLASDPHAPTVVPTSAENLPVTPGTYFRWDDTFYNHKHRIINSFEGITDTKKIAFYAEHALHQNDGLRKFEGTDRQFDAVVHRPNGFQIGDEMLIPGMRKSKSLGRGSLWQGVPLSAVKAGTAISTFSQNYWRGNDSVPNPYRNYATFIAVKPGDSVNGRQIGGKVIVSLVEHPMDMDNYAAVDLNTDYWINLAYNEGLITLNQKNVLLADPRNRNRIRELDGNQAKFERDSYWTHDDTYIRTGYRTIRPSENVPGDQYIGGAQKDQNAPATNAALQQLLATFQSIAGWSNAPWFMPTFSYDMDTITVFTPTLTHLGVTWLSDRTFVTGLKVPQENSAKSTAELLHPTVSVQKFKVNNVQAMLANARITETGVQGPDTIVPALPFEIYGVMTSPVTLIKADPMEVAAVLKTNISIFTTSSDEIVLYLNHVDPILYLREEIIK